MTELIWDGKYDDKGRKVAPPRIALPFQTVETVNESAAARDLNHELFSSGKPTEWRNRLVWGDKKYVLPSLLEEFAGKVNLIYIDPPFATGGDFSFTANVPAHPDDEDDDSGVSFTKQPSVIEQKAYRDTWGAGIDSYAKWMYETALILRELLADDGSVYVHLEPDVGNHVRVILDEVFGVDSMRTEIAWKRTSSHGNVSRAYGAIWECIYFYTKSPKDWTWNQQFVPFDPAYIQSHFTGKDSDGRRWTTSDLVNPGYRPNLCYEFKGYQPHRNGWKISREKMEELDRQGRLYFPTEKDGRIRLKRYLDETPGQIAQNFWTDISPINSQAHESQGYATQKPEALLERIIKTSSSEGDLVLDSFGGSGTTAAVAEKLGRRWITCDLGRFAIHTTRKRLLGIPNVRPFVVQNLGKYERQAWQAAEFGIGADDAVAAYRRFVLELYHAEPVAGFLWLHGNKHGRMVHIGGVDAPVTMADVTAMVVEFKKSTGKGKHAPTRSGIDVLGWDFAFELNETAKQQANSAGIDLRLIRIPRELLEKKAVEQGDIKFFELAALSVKVSKKARNVTLELTDFIIPLDDVPQDVQQAVTHWEQWIDYWAVDWSNSDDTFHNEWQSYRTRKEKSLARETTHKYAEPGTYRVVVKVIDILGNDTTRLLNVEVK